MVCSRVDLAYLGGSVSRDKLSHSLESGGWLGPVPSIKNSAADAETLLMVLGILLLPKFLLGLN